MRIALGVEYDGSVFCGWQSQRCGCSVQDALQRSLSDVAAQQIGLVAAGRTDAGVHAIGQVVHFDTGADRPLSAWVRGANTLLPKQIAVQWAQAVTPEFHARYGALERSYRYVLLNRPARPGVACCRVGWYHRPLDVDAMASAAATLVGEHDFSAFRAAECQADSPVRTMLEVGVTRKGDFVLFDFRANAFLHHMVRNLVGSLVYVGNGKHSAGWIAELLARRDRTLAAPTMGPEGLYLMRVSYHERWALPEARNASALPWSVADE